MRKITIALICLFCLFASSAYGQLDRGVGVEGITADGDTIRFTIPEVHEAVVFFRNTVHFQFSATETVDIRGDSAFVVFDPQLEVTHPNFADYDSSSFKIFFDSDGDPRPQVIDETGNVDFSIKDGLLGLGTASPLHLASLYAPSPILVATDTDVNIDISSAAQARDSSSITLDASSAIPTLAMRSNTGAVVFDIESDGDFNWRNGLIFADSSSGNVGIGTASPAVALEVVHSDGEAAGMPSLAGANDVAAFAHVSATGDNANVYVISGNAGDASVFLGDSDSAPQGGMSYNNAGTPSLRLFSGGGTRLTLDENEVLTVNDNAVFGLGSAAGRIEFDNQVTDEVNILSANVGIGTATPQHLLSSYKSNPVWALTDTDVNTNVSSAAEAIDSSAVAFDMSGEATVKLTATDGDAMQFATNTSDQMAFTGASGGYTFDSDIDLVDNLTVGDIIVDEAAGIIDGTGATSFTISSTGSNTVTIAAADTLDMDLLKIGASAAGVALNTDQFAVTVASGDSLLYGNGTNVSFWEATGTRSNIDEHVDPKPIKNALAKILDMQGYQFRFPGNPNLQAGMDAKEVDLVADEGANFSRGRGVVAYDAITAILVEAVKEQQKQIGALRREIEALKN